jgi:uncharacterized protein YggU (UPF0235/DUF167 family)
VRTIEVWVKPNSAKAGLEPTTEGHYVARVKAAPVEGKANDELVALIAAHFGLRRSQVSVRHGASGRRKLVTLDD